MSGLEVIGGISAVIGIIDACSKIYDSAQKDLKLPKTFETIRRHLPILSNTLTTFDAHLRTREDSLTPKDRKAFEDTVKSCRDNAKKLEDIFVKVISTEDDSWRERYVAAVKRLGKGSKVEELMRKMTEDIQMLVNNRVIQPVPREQTQQLDDAMKELQEAESSLPDEPHTSTTTSRFGAKQITQSGSGQQFNIDSMTGNQTFNFENNDQTYAGYDLNLSVASSYAWLTIAVVIRQKSFDFEKTFGPNSMKYLETALISQGVDSLQNRPSCDLSKPFFSVPLSKDPSFTGRDDVLNDLVEGYKVFQRMAVTGWAGVGKTQIAVEYCHRLTSIEPCPNIVWVRAESRSLFVQSYAKLAEQLGLDGWNDPEQDTNDLVCQWLTNNDARPWFMVLDNVDSSEVFEDDGEDANSNENPRQALATYLPDVAHVSILVTSRNSAAALSLTNEPSSVLHVPVMSEEEAIKLFDTKLPSDRSKHEDKIMLVRELHCLPLAVTQATAYIFKRRYRDVIKYLKLLEVDKDRVMSEASPDLRRDHSNKLQGRASNSVLRTWSISFEYIKQHNAKAAQLLCFLSLLQGQHFPVDVLKGDNKDVDFEYEDMVQPLVEFTLVVEEDRKNEFSVDSISIHKLVQLSVKSWLRANDTLKSDQERAVTSLADMFVDVDDPSQRVIAEYLIPHAHAVLQYEFQSKELHERCIFLHINCAMLFRQIGHSEEAMMDLKRATDLSETSLEDNHDFRVISLVFLIQSYLEQSMGGVAEAYARKKLDECVLKHGESHVLSLRLMLSLAEALNFNGKLTEAKQQAERYLCLATTEFGASSVRVFMGNLILAKVLKGRGQYQQAEQILRDHVDAPSISTHLEHIASVKIELSEVLISQGKVAEATILLEGIITSLVNVFGPNYHRLVPARCNMAVATYMSGDAELAIQMCDAILPELTTLHGTAHHLVLKIREIRIVSFKGYDDPMEPVKKLRDINTTRMTELKMEVTHPDCLLTSLNISATLAGADRYPEALSVLFEAHSRMIEVLGEDNYISQLASAQLAHLYWLTNDLKSAGELAIQAVDRAKRSFGTHQHVMVDAKSVLIRVYHEQGKYVEAKALCEEMLQDVKRTYREDSFQAIEAQKIWVTIQLNAGTELTEAEELLTKIIAVRRRKYDKCYSPLKNELLMLTNIQQQMKAHDKAEATAEQYLLDCNQHYGESDVRTTTGLEILHLVMTRKARALCTSFVEETESQEAAADFSRVFNMRIRDIQACRYTSSEIKALSIALKIYEIQARASAANDKSVLEAKERVADTLSILRAHEAALQIRMDIFAQSGGLTELEKSKAMSNVADSLRANEQYEEAAIMFVDLWQIQKRLLGKEHLDTLRTMNELALCKNSLERHQEAEVIWLEILELKKGLYLPSSLPLLHTYANLAIDLLGLERYTEAVDLSRKVLEGRSLLLGDQHESTLLARHNYALALKRQCDGNKDQILLEEAESVITQVLTIRNDILGPYHADTLWSLMLLTRILTALQRWPEAEGKCVELIQSSILRYGLSSRAILESHKLIVEILRLQDKHQTVADEREEMIAVYEKAAGPNHPDTLQIRYLIGHSLFLSGQREQGEQMVRGALNELLIHPSARYFFKADCWFKLTDLYERQGKWEAVDSVSREMIAKVKTEAYVEKVPFWRRKQAVALMNLKRGKEAVDVLVEDLSLREQVYGPCETDNTDTNIAYHVHSLAMACHTEGRIRPEAKEALQRRCAVIAQRTDATSYNAMITTSLVYTNVGDTDAENLFRQTSAMAQRLYGTQVSTYREAESELGGHLYLQGRYADAKEVASQCFEDYQHRFHFAESDPKLLRIQNDLAMSMAGCGEIDEARRIIAHVAELGEEKQGASSPVVLMWKMNLGFILRLNGDLDDSLQILTTTLNFREIVLGQTHSATNRSRRHLAETHIELGRYDKAKALLDQIPKTDDLQQRFIGPLITSLETEYLRGKVERLAGGEKAEEIIRNAIAEHVEILGPTHPHVQTAKLELVRTLLGIKAEEGKEEVRTLLVDIIKVLEDGGIPNFATALAAKQLLESTE